MMDKKGAFNIAAWLGLLFMIGVVVYTFPVLQTFLDDGSTNLANFTHGSLITTMLSAAVILAFVMIVASPFQVSQEETRRTYI